MAKDNLLMIVILGLIVGAFFYFQPSVNNGVQINEDENTQTTLGELQRTIPLEANPGETFEVIYSSDKTGKWGVIIVDSILGGCEFPAGREYKSVMLSNGFNSQIVEVIAPSSGSCTFSGDYNFGGDPIKKFEDQTVIIK